MCLPLFQCHDALRLFGRHIQISFIVPLASKELFNPLL
ncbi:hypothetical Protein YC6258_04301 [Gynuella sunshinyii YC6258]|uniref:Uncharacterized protein n=1 Tax=Gynuella sunshinyii YC6258 TaxID=1445510 RepID=A0A0C5VQ18_9GAMM|nr:hypothetical Protein YC6258_04301 [Gynuella sunshinyii YC6258]